VVRVVHDRREVSIKVGLGGGRVHGHFYIR
jgi:hypothetical protein